MVGIRCMAIVAPFAALALVGAGCGGDDDADTDGEREPAAAEADRAASPYERDACALLGPDDFEEVSGEVPPALPTEGDAATLTPAQCSWSGARPISLLVGDQSLFDSTRIASELADDFDELEGVAEAAFVGGGQGGVLIDDTGITISVLGVGVDQAETRELVAELLSRAAANY